MSHCFLTAMSYPIAKKFENQVIKNLVLNWVENSIQIQDQTVHETTKPSDEST